MSAPPSIDAYDAQMLDFSSDPDVPMNITSTAEFFVEALMDHDSHLAASTYGEHPSVEVDMEEYVGDNAEYEMADETAEYHRSHSDEPLDIEVYDASHAPSPFVPPQPLLPSTDLSIDSGHQAMTSQTYSEQATLLQVQGESEPEPKSEVQPASLNLPAADASHVEPSASGEIASLEAVTSEQPHPSGASDESHPPTSESHEQPGDPARTDGQLLEAPAPADVGNGTENRAPPVTEVHPANLEAVQHANVEPPSAESLLPIASSAGAAVQDEKATEEALTAGEEVVNPLHISDGVYIDLPPAVLLSVADLPEPGFALFNLPDMGRESMKESRSDEKIYSPLLEDRPTLYYEPLSSVFEALRQDEGLLSRVPHSFEGELVLDAYDLQLAVSEDNVHSREISLHDLNILHDGSDLVGPLRLHLRAIVPRFIIRYYALQERVQRLHVTAETDEGEHDEEHHEHDDTPEQRAFSQQEEETERLSTIDAAASKGSELPPATEAEKSGKPRLVSESTQETLQEGCELEETSVDQEPPTGYHRVSGEAVHALEDEDDYEGANVGDEVGSAKSDSLDADQVHDVVTEDTDTPGTVTGQGLEFGGEQAAYLNYVHPEEYDEKYSQDLPERAGGASSVQYDEPPHYVEEEQNTPTAVGETQGILPGSDENEEDQSTPSPVPACVILEPESSEPVATVNAADELGPQENYGEELVIGESKNSVNDVESSGNPEPSTVQARALSEVEESDSNFVKMLEREADTEFNQIFNAEQGGQASSIEATLQHDETWDEWDDEDAEGDDEEDWIDPDADSNESSATLSSKESSKRNHDQVDPSEEPYAENSQNSPGLKRPRVL